LYRDTYIGDTQKRAKSIDTYIGDTQKRAKSIEMHVTFVIC